MSWWWLLPLGAGVVASVIGALGTVRLRRETEALVEATDAIGALRRAVGTTRRSIEGPDTT